MDIQEAIERMKAMGFLEVTEQYNAEHQTTYAFVFFHPTEGPEGFRAYCDTEQGVFQVLGILEEWWKLGRFESQHGSSGYESCL